jgi:predicted ATP-dependent endonuclease of OLD family
MDERSDGLRWFIALRAFLSRPESVKPILLVDEAESHLHYDAQADLVAVLEAQDLAASVIYTTHSVGCLPSDLGTGIRLVVVKDAQHSTLDNSFWSSGPGITPLLFGMGARLLAFTAIRVVVLAEGPSECVLLPTLLREATDRDDVGFRIVPGLAVVADDDFDTLAQEAARMGFLVDGDPGGRRIRDKLVGAGVDARKIIALRDLADNGLQLEDLVSVDTFVAAVNEEIQRWQPGRPTIQRTDVETGDHRMDAVKKWCSANGVNVPSKVALAQRVVDRRVLGPCLVSPTHLHALRRTYWELWTGLTL